MRFILWSSQMGQSLLQNGLFQRGKVMFTEVGIENLQQIIRNLRGDANPPSKPVAERNRKKPRLLRP
ncbi:hypothetical protein ELH53_32760 (plasmid) [Rhizobium ruizarguesonis]|nr:hypothetical protein ELH53_32760 [Rhizobium ruizarguesonis]